MVRWVSLLQSGFLVVSVFSACAVAGPAPQWHGPIALALSPDGNTVFVANASSRTVFFVEARSGKLLHTVEVEGRPTALALSPDGRTLHVACAAPVSKILALDTSSGAIAGALEAGHTTSALVLSPDGNHLFACNRFGNDVWRFNLRSGREVGRLRVVREPVAAAITPDGRTLVVANHLPAGRADRYGVAACVTLMDGTAGSERHVKLPNGSTGLRGVCLSPDGRYAFVTHILARYELPTTQIEFGWINANALSIVDIGRGERLNTVLLDDKFLGAANPWGVACSEDGRWLCVAHAGTHELSIIDLPALMARLAKVAAEGRGEVVGETTYDDRNEVLDFFRRQRAAAEGKRYEDLYDASTIFTIGGAEGVSNDLDFLAGIRHRVALRGKGPRAVVVADGKAYVADYFTDQIEVVSLAERKVVGRLALGPPPSPTPERLGEMFFNDATLCYQHWQSCASCHPEGRADGLNWDLLNDGMGNLKNTKSLLLSHKTPPVMSAGVRASAEAAVRAGFTHILFARPREDRAAAIDAYLKSLRPVPSPHLVEGHLSPAAQRGKALFFDPKIGCSACHPPPLYTDLKRYDVGSKGPTDLRSRFDTPTLIEVWRTAPYLHDGRYESIRDVILKGRHGLKDAVFKALSKRQIEDLIEFVLSL